MKTFRSFVVLNRIECLLAGGGGGGSICHMFNARVLARAPQKYIRCCVKCCMTNSHCSYVVW